VLALMGLQFLINNSIHTDQLAFDAAAADILNNHNARINAIEVQLARAENLPAEKVDLYYNIDDNETIYIKENGTYVEVELHE